MNRPNSSYLRLKTDDYNICLVFPVHKDTGMLTTEGMKVMKELSTKINKSNFFVFFSKGKDEIYVILRLEEEDLKEVADIYGLSLLADPDVLYETVKNGLKKVDDKPAVEGFLEKYDSNPDKLIELKITSFKPFQYIYLEYDKLDELQILYSRDKEYNSPFADRHRIQLLRLLISEKKSYGGIGLNLKKLMLQEDPETKNEETVILGFYAVHKANKLQILSTELANGLSCFQSNFPFHLCNEYFGEKIALYYTFLKHFYDGLMITALFGVCVQIAVSIINERNHAIVAAFSVYITLWGVYFTETWKRKEIKTALKHGMIGFEKREANRAEFEEDFVLQIVGRQEFYFSNIKKSLNLFKSFLILSLLIVCVIVSTAFIFIFRVWFSGLSEQSSVSAAYVTAVLNSVQREIFTFIYSYISDYLTDSENHKTETEHENSMILKSFVFSFVNAYISFFYLIFFAPYISRNDYPNMPPDAPQKKWTGQCGAPTCMDTLAINLGVVMGFNIIIGSIIEQAIPYIKFRISRAKESDDSSNPIEIDFSKPEYSSKNILMDYLQVTLSYGYMTMFIAPLPAMALLVDIYVWFQLKGDSWKLCNLYRRPWPESAEDIGSWQSIFELLNSISVITNGALIIFTMQLFDQYTISQKFWAYIIFQWIVFTLQFMIKIVIPDVSQGILIQKERQDYLNRKIIKREIDHNEDDHIVDDITQHSFEKYISEKLLIPYEKQSFLKYENNPAIERGASIVTFSANTNTEETTI